MTDPLRYVYEGRACTVVNERRTNNLGGRKGSAWYTEYAVNFDGQVERIPAGQFNGKVRCGCCGKRVTGACACHWDRWTPRVCFVHELMTEWTEERVREGIY